MGYFLYDSSGKQIRIGLTMRMGSDPANQIVLDDAQVSAFHAILGEQPDGLLIRDENSTEGTFINDMQITATTRLSQGDRIRLGGTEFFIGSTEPVPPAAPIDQSIQPESDVAPARPVIVQAEPPAIPAVPVIIHPEPPSIQKPSEKVEAEPVIVPFAPATIQPAPAVPGPVRIPPPPPPPPPTPLPTASQAPSTVHSGAPAPLPPVKEKKSGGCFKWALTIFLVLILGCVVLGGGGYLLLRAGIIPQRMIDNTLGMGTAQISIYNFTDQTVYIRIQQKFEDETTITMPQIYWDLAPYDSNTELSFSGTNEREIMTIGTTKDGNELGTCIFVARQTDNFNIVVLPDKVLIDNVLYPEYTDKPPASGKDLILATSSICE